MKKILSFLLIIVIAFSFSIIGSGIIVSNFKETQIEQSPLHKLEFSGDEFVILQLSDFHEWAGVETDNGIVAQDRLKPLLVSFITSALEKTKPNLVVLTGDLIFPLSFLWDFLGNVSIDTLKLIANIFEEREQLWTMTFGNHDTESGIKKEDFLSTLSSYQYFIGPEYENSFHKSYIQEVGSLGQTNRVGNYSIPIFSNDEIKFNLFLLDSGSYYQPGNGPRDYLPITNEQTDWYISESIRLNALTGSLVPSIMFTHIPLIEMAEQYDINQEFSYGIYGGISPSSLRSPLYQAIMNQKDVRGIFFGHNHQSSLTLFAEDTGHRLMMGITPSCQASSYDDSTSTMYGRIINIYANGSFSSYIYTSDNSYTNNIFLNETAFYGFLM